MRKKFPIQLAVALLAVCLAAPASLSMEGVECDPGRERCYSTGSGVPFRVLTKPDARLFSEPNENSMIIESDLGSLQAYFVTEMINVTFDRDTMESSGWYAVSPSVNVPATGFVKAEDVVPWRQALAVAFTNPGASERKPVVMYESLPSLEGSLAEIDAGKLTGDQLHADIDAGTPADGIVTRERNVFTDISESFYLMPIVEHDDLSVYYPGGDMRALRVTVLTGDSAASQAKACDVASADFSQCQAQSAKSGGAAAGLGIDVVFVVDMTSSMGPYIDAVRRSIRQVARKLGESPDSGSIRFGLIGYRDNLESNPDLNWTTRNFTPELLEPAGFDEMISSDAEIAAASAGSGDFPEEVFAGVKAATEAAWRPEGESARMIILIGDASGHDATHAKSTTGLDEKALRDLTDSESIHTAAIYVGQNAGDLALARSQYETLAAGEEGTRAFEALSDTSGEMGLEGSLKSTIERMLDFMRTGDFSSIMSEGGGAPGTDEDAGATGAILAAARAAFVDYIGTGAAPPPSVTAWALDRDIAAFDKRAMRVKVLVTRTDIENLIDFLGGLLAQLETQQVSGSGFFATAQQGSTATTYDLSLAQGEELSQAGALPGAIADLPYKSEILTLTLDEFKNSSVDDRTRIEERLRSLVKYYEASLSNTDAWVLLNENGSVQDKVFLMDLEWLP